jgi:hypothetical protein
MFHEEHSKCFTQINSQYDPSYKDEEIEGDQRACMML